MSPCVRVSVERQNHPSIQQRPKSGSGTRVMVEGDGEMGRWGDGEMG
ncbi:MAG: hypothetical protein F6K24_52880 [Okeania sp. SIO2D1]|nr:hypothetical protein [Okeania sp. SIO2D1]